MEIATENLTLIASSLEHAILDLNGGCPFEYEPETPSIETNGFATSPRLVAAFQAAHRAIKRAKHFVAVRGSELTVSDVEHLERVLDVTTDACACAVMDVAFGAEAAEHTRRAHGAHLN